MPLLTKTFSGLQGRVITVPSLVPNDAQYWEVNTFTVWFKPTFSDDEVNTDQGFRPGVAVQLVDVLELQSALLCQVQKSVGSDVQVRANTGLSRIRIDLTEFTKNGHLSPVPPPFEIQVRVGPRCATDTVFEATIGALTSWDQFGNVVRIGNEPGSRVELWYRLRPPPDDTKFGACFCFSFDRFGGDSKVKAGSLVSLVAIP